MEIPQKIIDWLLDSDPAIRWQVMQDLLHAPPATYETERARLTQEGWCARLLQIQDPDGLWNRSLYNGKWLSTTYSLTLLKLLGLPPAHPQARSGCRQLLTRGLYQEQEIRFSRQQNISDLGVSAIVLSLCCSFWVEHAAIPNLAGWIISRQNQDGSWVPNESASAAAYTFETTLLVLEALLQYTQRYALAGNQAVSQAEHMGQDFLLAQHFGLSGNKPLKSKWSSFSYPAYWFYDILTALDYFYRFQANRDRRIQTAIDLLRHKQTEAGSWLLGARHAGRTYFDMEKPGEPSRWNTLRALRVLNWWDGD
jgi:hypothetical protein